jgi:DNA segregation ATPase FtsK/SpoIIIE, S-DNA-T family
MSKKNRNGKWKSQNRSQDFFSNLHPDALKSIWAIVFFGLAIILILAGIGKAGPVGEWLHKGLETLVGIGYFVVPLSFIFVAIVFLVTDRQKILGVTLFGATILILSILGFIEIISPDNGGWMGLVLGSLKWPFGEIAAGVINVVIMIVAVIMTANLKIKFPRITREENEAEEKNFAPVVTGVSKEDVSNKTEDVKKHGSEEDEPNVAEPKSLGFLKRKRTAPQNFANYVPPPPDLLKSSVEKPTTGDLRANANIIKRTLESFGIAVEMGEINIGPKVTRYTLKPAEGVKLSRITALNQDMALALAAHPIRIEAPIPGKALVGIEVPNKAAAVVRIGSLMSYPEFQTAGSLGFTLGRDVTGEPLFADIEKMPHLLIAGATGSGKSVTIHSLIVSLLYKNSPATLKLIMIDPKRVELSAYEGLPHLVGPVITESKKAIGVFRWALSEMDRRYGLLQGVGSRDIKSYNSNGGKGNPLSYLVIIVDELADLMTSYGREVEGSIVRLAQMARATGIHLVLSTQRPSVEIITGLIKANITSRIALQVASQVDSRTILDTSGAEKLLGGGDLLFMSSDLSKPKRIQGAYISENEINSVADFIRDNNKNIEVEDEVNFGVDQKANGGSPSNGDMFDEYLASGDDDELMDDAVRVVGAAGKASASLLQRRLKVGYARAARLLDLMEERGIIGPGDGAKPREVFIEKIPQEEI